MKAIVYTGKKTPEGMRVRQVRKPKTGNHEVLVRVHAATVTASDVGGMGAHFPFKAVPKILSATRFDPRR